jgi:hypothetical protein
MRKSTRCSNEIRLATANKLCDMQRGKASKIELVVYQNIRNTIVRYVAGVDNNVTTCFGTTQQRSTAIWIKVAVGDPLLKSELSYYSITRPFSFILSRRKPKYVCLNMFHISPYIPIQNSCITTIFFRRSWATVNFPKIQEPHENCRRLKGDMKEIPHPWSKYIRGYRTKFSPGRISGLDSFTPALEYHYNEHVVQLVSWYQV